MRKHIIEEEYPISFRSNEAEKLGNLLKNRRSVVLVGMKRVGISNFLRFFLYHEKICPTYLNSEKHIFIQSEAEKKMYEGKPNHIFIRSEAEKKIFENKPNHIFIPVDLNDLVERDIFPFWILTLKRISDYIEENIPNDTIKKRVSQLFLDGIQSQDLFLTIDGIRKSLVLLSESGYSPTIFFIRFDRIVEYATPIFFGNFQGLIDATNNKLSFVFTSVRPLDTLSSEVFTKHALSVFADTLYVKPAKSQDVNTILQFAEKQYQLSLDDNLKKKLLSLVDGYNQYLQFALISLHEEQKKLSEKNLLEILLSDERINLQSEELYESLTGEEKLVVEKVINGEQISQEDRKNAAYLFDTGLITEDGKFFSVLFEKFLEEKKHVKKKNSQNIELSKKEHALLEILEKYTNDVCEREEIIEHVWQEAEAIGVSDWAIDRLVARLRNKLKSQNSGAEIITVKTRGYKLIKNQ